MADKRNKDDSEIERPILEKEKEEPKRDEWKSKTEFMLTCVGYSVGLSNFWRFPYLAFHYGGGAFIVPYIIMAILIGKPIYFVEAALGQFTNKGVTAFWHCCPVARGLAFSMTLVTTIVAIYYNILMVYCLFYLFQTFREVLPWSDCLEWWGADENCYVRSSNVKPCNLKQVMSHGRNASGTKFAHWKGTLANCTNASQTAAEMFWERYVIEISEGIEAPGKLKLNLLTCLIVSWTLCYICVRRGIKSSEKVVHFTATIPYAVLMALFIYGLTLQGSNHGLYYYFVPDWHRLFDLKVWGKALEQLFFSLSLGSGGLMTFSSYNKFQNPFDRDITFLVFLDTLTSIIGGVIVFSFVGSFAKKMNIDLSQVTKEGTDLCFVQLPEALSKLRLPQLWTFLFFSMLFLLGIDSQFGFLEVILTAITDSIPKTRNFKPYITFALCCTCFCFGLPCITQGGQHLIYLLDEYAAGIALTFIGLCELVIVMWIYGVENFCDDVETMIGYRPEGFVKFSWCYFTPLVLTCFLFAGFFKRTRLVYNNVTYPRWASTTGIFMSLLITGQIPGWAIYYMFKYRKDIRIAFSTTSQWGPADSKKRKEIQLRIHKKQKEFNSNYTDVVN